MKLRKKIYVSVILHGFIAIKTKKSVNAIISINELHRAQIVLKTKRSKDITSSTFRPRALS